jgi:predicted KAP-like P-loop ATPase
MNQNFSSDKPVKLIEQDKFQRYTFSKRIAQTIINRNSTDGIVIGIYGKWGEGKTSILNFIKEEIRKEESILILTFNPWRYNDEDKLMEDFFKKIATLLDKELETKKEKFGKFIKKYGSLTSFFGADISYIGGNIGAVDLEVLKERIDELLEDGENKLVIIIDDIDRLDKQEIYSLFRLVKLNADFSNTTYILSFDDRMVASAIGERFGNGNEKAGQNFLEKIIQVPLHIPQAQPDALEIFCSELVYKAINESELELSDGEIQRFSSEFLSNVLIRLKTPRLAIRYGNSLSFVLPLLKGEVNHVDLMLIEAIKVFYPNHYHFIKSSPDYFLSSYSSNYNFSANVNAKRDELSEHLEKLSSDLTKRENDAIIKLLKGLFPNVSEAFHGTVQHDGITQEWEKNKRIVSTSYFQRYFSYSIIQGELSDVMFDNFIDNLETSDILTIELSHDKKDNI